MTTRRRTTSSWLSANTPREDRERHRVSRHPAPKASSTRWRANKPSIGCSPPALDVECSNGVTFGKPFKRTSPAAWCHASDGTRAFISKTNEVASRKTSPSFQHSLPLHLLTSIRISETSRASCPRSRRYASTDGSRRHGRIARLSDGIYAGAASSHCFSAASAKPRIPFPGRPPQTVMRAPVERAGERVVDILFGHRSVTVASPDRCSKMRAEWTIAAAACRSSWKQQRRAGQTQRESAPVTEKQPPSADRASINRGRLGSKPGGGPRIRPWRSHVERPLPQRLQRTTAASSSAGPVVRI